MGKKYLVVELENKKEKNYFPIIIVGIIAFSCLVNYSVFQSFFETLTNLNELMYKNRDVVGILLGLSISCFLGLMVFIKNWLHGYQIAFVKSSRFMLISNFFGMLIGSIIMPALIYYSLYKSIDFQWMDLIFTILANGFILLLSTPLITLISSAFVFVLGIITSPIIYKIIFLINTLFLKKTNYYQELSNYLKEEKNGNIYVIEIYQNKIIFLDFHEQGIKEIFYEQISLLSQYTLLDIIKRKTKENFKLIKEEKMLKLINNKCKETNARQKAVFKASKQKIN